MARPRPPGRRRTSGASPCSRPRTSSSRCAACTARPRTRSRGARASRSRTCFASSARRRSSSSPSSTTASRGRSSRSVPLPPGSPGEEALEAIGRAYGDSLESDHTMLQGQLQSYAASVEDEDIREATARGYGRLVDYVETVSGADRVDDRPVLRQGNAHERARGDGVHARRVNRRTRGPRGWPRGARRTSDEGSSLFSPDGE